RGQLEVDPGVDAPLPEVAVQRAPVVIAVEELPEVAEIRAELVDGDRRVLPAFPRVVRAGDARGRAEPGLADAPDDLLLTLLVEQLRRRRMRALRARVDHAPPARVGLLLRIPAELDQQP